MSSKVVLFFDDGSLSGEQESVMVCCSEVTTISNDNLIKLLKEWEALQKDKKRPKDKKPSKEED